MADEQDPLELLLRGSRLSNPQRAMAWDAFTQAKTADELKSVLDNLNLPSDVKGGLWNLKEQEAPQAAPESFGRALWNTVNPVEAVKGLYHAVESPEAAGRTAQGLAGAQVDQAKQAWAAAQQGRYSEAVGHAGAAALPLLGPAAAHAGERIGTGDVAGGLGESAGLLLPFGAQYAAEAAQVARGARAGAMFPGGGAPVSIGEAAQLAATPTAAKVAATRPYAPRIPVLPAALAARSPRLRAAVEWGQAQGLPIDVATATGNRFARWTQKTASESALGSILAEPVVEQQAAAMFTKGRELAGEGLSGPPVSKELAGEAVRMETQGARNLQHHAADEAGDRLREIESQQPLTDVPVTDLERQRLRAQRNDRARDTLGNVPTDAEFDELRRIAEQMDAKGFEAAKQVEINQGMTGATTEYVPRSAGDPVYHEIMQQAPGTAQMTRTQVLRSLRNAIDTGKFTNAARGALDVARRRLRDREWSGTTQAMNLPPEVVPTEAMRMPVDLRGPKLALEGLYEDIRSSPWFKGQQDSPGFQALRKIVEGPDYAPHTQVARDLSALKTLARGGRGAAEEAAIQTTRSTGQGLAAQAVRQVEEAVQQAVQQAGPEAVQARTALRTATKRKYVVEEVLKKMGGEPVGITNALMRPRDEGIKWLRRVKRIAPETGVPMVARALLDDLFDAAQVKPGLEGATTIKTKWDAIGPATKKELYPTPGHVEQIDHLVELMAQMAKNPNPSGSGLGVVKSGELLGLYQSLGSTLPISVFAGGLARLMHSPATARALVRGLRVPARSAARGLVGAQIGRMIAALPPEEEP